MVRCEVFDCCSKTRRQKGVGNHRFPLNDPPLLKVWVDFCKRKDFVPNQNSRMCSQHFDPEEDYEPMPFSGRKLLKRSAAPKYRLCVDEKRRKECALSVGVGEGITSSLVRADVVETVVADPNVVEVVVVEPDVPKVVSFEEHSHSFQDEPCCCPVNNFLEISSREETPEAYSTATRSIVEEENEGRFFLVHEEALDQLFEKCNQCSRGLRQGPEKHVTGTAVTYTTECLNGHSVTWASQPHLHHSKHFLGNVLIVAAVILSGITCNSLISLGKLLNLCMIEKAAFYNLMAGFKDTVSRCYQHHSSMVKDVLKTYEHVVLTGDGRFDRPGHSAGYCSYSVQDSFTGLVVDFELLQRRPNGSPVKLENACEKVLSRLQESYRIDAFCTDRSPSVIALMKRKFSGISHQFDQWHLVKSVIKKLTELARTKNMELFSPWIHHVANHLWYSVESSKGDENALVKKWREIVYHISGKHVWVGEDGHLETCDHGDLPDDKEIEYLNSGSPVYLAFSEIALSTQLLRDIRNLSSMFIHTSSLENYHSSLLKYVPKHLFFSSSMQMRIQLGIMDHNYSVDRVVFGEHSVFRKATESLRKNNAARRRASKKVKGQKSDDWKFRLMHSFLSQYQ